MKDIAKKTGPVVSFIAGGALVAAVFYVFVWAGKGNAFEAGVSRALTRIAYAAKSKPEPAIILDVPFHRQERALSCEIASLRSALLYRGIDVSERDLTRALSFDPTPGKFGVWGDPYKGFVGDIDGKMFKTGYGVYWDPIAEVAQLYRQAESFSNWDAVRLAEELANGNPVIVWNYVGNGERGVWRTRDGKIIIGVNGEHTRVAMGYTGSKENPDGFYLMDPIYGRVYESRDDFLKKWGSFDYSGVVVH